MLNAGTAGDAAIPAARNPTRLAQAPADPRGQRRVGFLAAARTEGLLGSKDQTIAALNDKTLFLLAPAHGLVVLTRNLRDFDALAHILPEERVLFYEANA